MSKQEYSDTGVAEFETLRKYAKERGYKVSKLDRGPRFVETNRHHPNAGRFEIWLENNNEEGRGRFNSKIAFDSTLLGAVEKATPEIRRYIEETKQD